MSWGIVASVGGSLLTGYMNKNSGGGSQTQSREMPPWLQRRVAGEDGNGGLLADVESTYRNQMQNGGLNPLQSAGIEAQRQWLTSPTYMQGPNAMLGQGLNLLNRGVMQNPITGGGIPGGRGLLGMNSSRGLLGQSMQGPQAQQTQPVSFNYTMNPTMQGALTGVPAPTQQQQQTTAAPTMEEIMAEWERRQREMALLEWLTGPGNDGTGGIGIGDASNPGGGDTGSSSVGSSY